jgi:hypothetical protein
MNDMDKQTDALAARSFDEVEVGFYPAGAGAICVFVNQGGVCIFRERVGLHAELSGAARGALTADVLRAMKVTLRVENISTEGVE